MQIQYVYDTHGRKTAVIVPISMWQKKKAPDKSGKTTIGITNPDQYRGIYRDLRVNLKAEIKKLRAEWDRL
jgi:hypothetical protein